MKCYVKDYRIKFAMTQEFVARSIDITLRSYQMIENKKSTPSIEVVLKLARLFNCRCIDLYELD